MANAYHMHCTEASPVDRRHRYNNVRITFIRQATCADETRIFAPRLVVPENWLELYSQHIVSPVLGICDADGAITIVGNYSDVSRLIQISELSIAA